MSRGVILYGVACIAIVLVIAEMVGSARILRSSYFIFDDKTLSSLVSCSTTSDGAVTNNEDGSDEDDMDRPSNLKHPRLEFVHIPKTGGTVIESEAARHNITWAICHFAYPQAAVRISMNETICPEGSLKYPWPKQEKYHQCPWWHVPPQYLELQGANPYDGANLFAVVRNVYDRIISEYYYMGTYLTENTADELNDVAEFNAWLDDLLRRVAQMRRGDIGRNRTGNAAYFINAGHWIPQYHYIFEHRRQLVKHVLRFENLAEDFHALMDVYNLPLRLPKKQVRKSHEKKLGVFNMTLKNLELIEMIYEDDFLEWGYDIMSEIIPAKTLARNRRISLAPRRQKLL